MGLPWVSRRAYNDLRDQLTKKEAQYDDLFQRYDALKVAPVGPSPIPTPLSHEPKLPPAILMQAIRTVSPVQDQTYAANFAYAMSLEPAWSNHEKMLEAASLILTGRQSIDRYDQ